MVIYCHNQVLSRIRRQLSHTQSSRPCLRRLPFTSLSSGDEGALEPLVYYKLLILAFLLVSLNLFHLCSMCT